MPSYSNTLGDATPGPYLKVRLAAKGMVREIQGILDTGADQTMIPLVTAGEMRLRQISDVNIGDANGGWRIRPVYVVDVTVGERTFQRLPVAGLDYPVVLVGRDILNTLVVTFDGPNLEFKLS